DYSSVMWDFSLQKKPVFLFHPDLDKYQKERGYYLSFGQMPYIEAVSNEELYRKIRDFDEQSYRKKLDDFLKKYGSFDSGNASAEVAERVITILGGMGRKDRGGI
ncbi:MAG: CDP-glycerol glycerophosphotransferase family protein, partial [Lachnospiraceae bacterium]|nr:CDP-glycerol glycerophosphotransferase family protein [Lachnospiraceae bacterium]